MSDAERRIVYRLLITLERSRKPTRFKVSLPPAFGELERWLTDNDAQRQANAAALNGAIRAVEALLIEETTA
jgi:hypothetical protein